MNRQEIEKRVLMGLKERLMAPELVREFIRAYHDEVNRAAAEFEANQVRCAGTTVFGPKDRQHRDGH